MNEEALAGLFRTYHVLWSSPAGKRLCSSHFRIRKPLADERALWFAGVASAGIALLVLAGHKVLARRQAKIGRSFHTSLQRVVSYLVTDY